MWDRKRRCAKSSQAMHNSPNFGNGLQFYTTSEGRNNCQYGDGPPTTFHNWTMGSLNRITGKFFAHERVKSDDSDDYHILTWKMTCVPVRQKF
jgi:hypothetical protein